MSSSKSVADEELAEHDKTLFDLEDVEERLEHNAGTSFDFAEVSFFGPYNQKVPS